MTTSSSGPGRILLVEDDEVVRDLHNAVLIGAGYDTRTAGTLAELRAHTGRSKFDIILLDLRLPDGNALDVIPELRGMTRAGIVVATSSRDQQDRLSGLESGADDYLEKPIHPRELLARIRNLSTRLNGAADSPGRDTVFHFEGWTADLVSRKIAFRDGRDVHLTESEFRLLEALIRQDGKPIHRERLVTLISDDEEITTRAVDKVVYRTRVKLHAYIGNAAPLIETVHGFGYRLVARRL